MLQAWPTHHVEMGGLPDPDPLVRGSDPDPSLFFWQKMKYEEKFFSHP
jgi:hypothetical protein